MGVTYKLRDEVVHFIISERQQNPLFSCRQLAESASQKFGLHLSKSSVHDVLKESGIMTPRGRKPKDKFTIPQEKKKQIQASLSQVKLLPSLPEPEPLPPSIPSAPKEIKKTQELPQEPIILPPPKKEAEISEEYEGAGKIFLKAALWDIGVFSQEKIKESDWEYYLTYSKGVKVILENQKEFFITLPLPIERCIAEIADGLVNGIRPLIVQETSDEGLLKACMEGESGFKIQNVSIVGQKDHIMANFDSLMDCKRDFLIKDRIFVDSIERDLSKRAKALFIPQDIQNNDVVNNLFNLRGFDTIGNGENVVTISCQETYDNKSIFQEAADRLNRMFLRDEQGREVKVKIFISPG